MKEAGCKRVFVAPESGSDRVLKEIIGKNLDLQLIENAVVLFKKHGITVDGSFVIGSIGETKREVWQTIRYALKLKKLGIATAGIHIATPYYGTKLYEEAVKKGYLRADFNSELLTTCEPLISTPELSMVEIRRLQRIATLLFQKGLKDKIIYILWNIPFVRSLKKAVVRLIKGRLL
jgi:anaerobic magnesium-protoporphyrin IX monomethyl ester cyclase